MPISNENPIDSLKVHKIKIRKLTSSMSSKYHKSRPDYLDYPKAKKDSDYSPADTSYKKNKSKFDSPQRSSKDTPKQTPKSILKESNGFSAHKKKRNIIINEDQNKTHNISQPSETQNSYVHDTSVFNTEEDTKKRLHSDSSASDLSRRSYDRSMNKYDPLSSDDSFQEKLQIKATTLNEFYKPNYHNRSLEFDSKKENIYKRTDITDSEMNNIRQKQIEREKQLASKYKSLTDKVQASIEAREDLSSERRHRQEKTSSKTEVPSKVLIAQVEDKFKNPVIAKAQILPYGKETKKFDDSKLKNSLTKFDEKPNVSLMPRAYPVSTTNVKDSAKANENKFRSSFQDHNRQGSALHSATSTATGKFGPYNTDKIKSIDEKFKGIESKISAIESDITQYQAKLKTEVEKDKKLQQEFGKEYDKIDNKVKGIKTELNKSFERSRIESYTSNLDTSDLEPSGIISGTATATGTAFYNSKKLSSDGFFDHQARSSSFSKTSYNDKEEGRLSFSNAAKKKKSTGTDLRSELDKLRQENEYLRNQLLKTTKTSIPPRNVQETRKKTPLRDRSLETSTISNQTNSKKKVSYPKAASLTNVSREQELLDAIERIKEKLKSTIKKPLPFEDNYSMAKGTKMNSTFSGSNSFSGVTYLDGLKKRALGFH